jgi:hypothetical protein
MKNHIDKEELVKGFYYKGHCRNATIARWDGEAFTHWREKFGYKYLETISCPEDEERYDVFFASEWVDAPDKEIPLTKDGR